jgi:hypothetical protein
MYSDHQSLIKVMFVRKVTQEVAETTTQTRITSLAPDALLMFQITLYLFGLLLLHNVSKR